MGLPHRNLAIEFDWEQHFEVHDFSGKDQKAADEKFKITQKHDQMKNEYCKDKGIKLIRIPYWEFDNIKKIMKKELK